MAYLCETFSALAVIKARTKHWPGWCGSVDGASSHKAEGHRFNPQPGHKPGFAGLVPS